MLTHTEFDDAIVAVQDLAFIVDLVACTCNKNYKASKTQCLEIYETPGLRSWLWRDPECLVSNVSAPSNRRFYTQIEAALNAMAHVDMDWQYAVLVIGGDRAEEIQKLANAYRQGFLDAALNPVLVYGGNLNAFFLLPDCQAVTQVAVRQQGSPRTWNVNVSVGSEMKTFASFMTRNEARLLALQIANFLRLDSGSTRGLPFGETWQ